MDSVQDMATEVADLMKANLRIRGKDLTAKLRHTGRLLPKRIKREATYLAETVALAENPKLQRMIDYDKANSAHKTCIEFLNSVDLADRRKGALLGILSSFAMAFIVVAVLVISVLVWRGFI